MPENNATTQASEAATFVIGLSADGVVRKFPNKEAAGQDVQVFESDEDLDRINMQDLEALRGQILKVPFARARNKEEAVRLTWNVLLAASNYAPEEKGRKGKGGGGSRTGNKTVSLLYDFDSPGKSEEKFNKLPPQARTCLQIMARSGKKDLSEADLRKMIEDNAADLKTKQGPWRIFQYYRPRLIDEKMIKVA